MQHIENHCCSEVSKKINDCDIKPDGVKDMHVYVPLCDFIDNHAMDATEHMFPRIWVEYKR